MERRAGVGVRKKLGEMLLEGAFITEEQLKNALDIGGKTHKKLGEVLLEQKALTPETLATVLSFQLNVPVINLNQYKIQPEALRLIPEQVAREHNILPLSVEGNVLRVVMEDPQDLQVLDNLAALTRMTIRSALALHGGLREAINASYKLTAQIVEEVSRVPQAAAPRVAAEPTLEAEAVAQAPVVRAVDMVITQAVRDRASDIHIIPVKDGVKVHYRIDGTLHESVTLPRGVHNALISRIKVLSSMNIAERRRPQDGQFSMKVGDKEVDFRVATAETSHGEMMVLRVLDKSASFLKLPELGFQPGPAQVYQNLLHSPFGMVMASGPTGSGKTTTLYASLNQIIGLGRNIMTIEDPIEYHFEVVNQIQVNRQAGITFASGLRAIMRLDPDIILVGEIRDAETAGTAVQAALTGHLVLTSIHANDAASALVRLIDLDVERFLVTSATIGAVAQRLVRRVCPYCREMAPVSPAEALAYQQEMQEVRHDFYVGRGCNFCSNTGFLGRVGVMEVLPVSDQIRSLLGRGATAHEIKEQAIKEGMVTLRRDGMLKARDGVTTPGEVLRNVFTIG